MSEVGALAQKSSITMQLASDDTTAQGTSHTLDHLRSLTGADRDSAFVNHEIADHKNDIDENQKMTAAAQAPGVKALLQKELPELKKHLAAAEKLARQPAGKK